jgi:hypothetical protein
VPGGRVDQRHRRARLDEIAQDQHEFAAGDVLGDQQVRRVDDAEPARGSGILGRVASKIVADQFAIIRNGDPYFYLWDKIVETWRDEIHRTRLSDIIERNTKVSAHYLPRNVFKL